MPLYFQNFPFDFSGLKAGKIKRKIFYLLLRIPGLKAGAIRMHGLKS
jgi:hypothetical protein